MYILLMKTHFFRHKASSHNSFSLKNKIKYFSRFFVMKNMSRKNAMAKDDICDLKTRKTPHIKIKVNLLKEKRKYCKIKRYQHNTRLVGLKD